MKAMDVIAWLISVCVGVRKSQINTLGHIVSAALWVGRVSLAELGRLLAEQAHGLAKHAIKRVWRFVANERVRIGDVMRGPLQWLFHRRRWKKRPLIVALDWVVVRRFRTLVAAAVIQGRALPLLWVSYRDGQLCTSQNRLEEDLLRSLRALIPDGLQVILVADRGFGRTQLARVCQQLGFHYVIRIRPEVYIRSGEFQGKLSALPVRRGILRVLQHVQFRKNDPVLQHVVICWPSGLSECWYLMTDLAYSAEKLTRLYSRRMCIEELFRDSKNRRHGWGLRDTLITRPERLDRLLLILVLAYWLLVGVGLVALERQAAGLWCSNNHRKVCSVFFIGRHMIRRLEIPCLQTLTAVVNALLAEAENWG